MLLHSFMPYNNTTQIAPNQVTRENNFEISTGTYGVCMTLGYILLCKMCDYLHVYTYMHVLYVIACSCCSAYLDNKRRSSAVYIFKLVNCA